jgi:hypothetical protein
MTASYPHPVPDACLSLLGLVASGDLADITCYRSKRGKIVAFAKTWPEKNPSLAQLTGRARMYFGAEQWRGFTAAQKQAWRDVARKTSLCGTGYGMWIHWWFRPDYRWLSTLYNHTGIWLLPQISQPEPRIPTPMKFQRPDIYQPSIYGEGRYGRHTVIMSQNNMEWLMFLPYHYALPAEQAVTLTYTVTGPGTFVPMSAWNQRWLKAQFFSTSTLGGTSIKVKFTWSDGDTAHVLVHVFTEAM